MAAATKEVPALVYRVKAQNKLAFCMAPGAVGDLKLQTYLTSTVSEGLAQATETNGVPVVLEGPVLWTADTQEWACARVLRLDVRRPHPQGPALL